MKTYFVYMLLCADGSFYVGITNDVGRSVLAEHELGIDQRMLYVQAKTGEARPLRSYFDDVVEAIAWEKQLKGWRR